MFADYPSINLQTGVSKVLGPCKMQQGSGEWTNCAAGALKRMREAFSSFQEILYLSTSHCQTMHSMTRPTVSHDTMRGRVAFTESLNKSRRDAEKFYALAPVEQYEVQQIQVARKGQLPPLPPRLPRPEYATKSKLIGEGVGEVGFYAACEQGLVPQVASFVQEANPTQAVRQFGLEQASFGNQPVVARYLLEHGTAIHDNAFFRREKDEYCEADNTIFDNGHDSLPLIQVFLDFGWHPNQLWNWTRASDNMSTALLSKCLKNKRLFALMLSRGAEPGLSQHNIGAYDITPLNRRSSNIVDQAVRQWDSSLIALLLDYGACLDGAQPLHKVIVWGGQGSKAPPFSKRRPMAQYLLSSGIAKVDEIKRVVFFDVISQPCPRTENITPFVYACAAQDWEMAKWLLEKGADSCALSGRAFEPLHFMMPHYGPSDPRVVKDLVRAVENEKGNSETHA
ncbi:hypothetical protein G7046_g475 [Stylonectria norvegica]|nr:hypothetical protein G7046_g475 [Stylonectria norvegica]